MIAYFFPSVLLHSPNGNGMTWPIHGIPFPKNTVHSLVKIVPVVLENMNKIEEVYDDYDKDDNERQLLAKLA